MTKKQYIVCLLLGIPGCLTSTLRLFNFFEFGQETGVKLPLIVGTIVGVQLMELILDRIEKS